MSPSSTISRKVDLLPNEQEVSYDRILTFFRKHRLSIIALSLLLIGAVIGGILWQIQIRKLETLASARLADSKTPDDLRAIIRDFPGTGQALVAMLTLGDLSFRQGNMVEASKIYQSILESYPDSILAPSAQLGLAAVAETTGKVDEAIRLFQSVAKRQGNPFQAAQAQFSAGRLLEDRGRWSEARLAFENLLAAHPESAWKTEAARRLQRIQTLLSQQTSAISK